MDFKGQRLAEQIMFWIITITAAISFIAGYVREDFFLMVIINGVGLAITLLAVLPSWPWYNRNPLKWLPPLNPDKAD